MKKFVSLIIALFFICGSIFTCAAKEYDMAYSFMPNGTARVVLGDFWGLIDTEENFILPASYEYIDEFQEGYLRVKKAGFYGFLNEEYETAVAFDYLDAKNFCEGLAAVKNEEGKWAFIDKDGNLICDFLYDDANSFSGGMAKVKSGALFGYIDASGNETIAPSFTESYDFSCGRACALGDNGKYGYIDKSGSFVIFPDYDIAWSFNEELAAVKKDNLFCFIDTSGNIKISSNFDRATLFTDGLAPVRLSGGKYGLIDKNGNLVINYKYDNIGNFSEGLALVRINDKYGYINSSGLLVIPALYTRADDFSDGYAFAGQNSTFGYIDKSGRFISSGGYVDGGKYSSGLANVRLENGMWTYTDLSETTPSVDEESTQSGKKEISLKINSDKIIIDQKEEKLPTAPIIENGRTLLPIRAIAEAAGATVTWFADTQKVEISSDDVFISLEIGSKTARVNGAVIPIDVAPKIQNDSTMLPLRFVAEALNMDVLWVEESSGIFLYY